MRKFGNKYYLYYAATVDPGNDNVLSETDTLPKRDRVQQNQKIGVIVFESFPDLLKGKFTHSDKPLLEPRTRVKPDNVLAPSPQGTEPKPDNLIVVNPAVVYRPTDGKYLLFFKGNIYDPHWRGIHGVAISDHPDGPFTALDEPSSIWKVWKENYQQKILTYGITSVTSAFMPYSRTSTESSPKETHAWPSCVRTTASSGSSPNIPCS